jgi:hypothetical protein
MALTKKHQQSLQAERLAFLEKHVKEVAREKHLVEIVLEQLQPRVIILEADPKPLPIPDGFTPLPGNAGFHPWTPPRTDSFLSEHERKLITEHPGMLFYCSVTRWQVGLTHDKSRLVFVPDALYKPYENECLLAVGWSEQQEEEYEEDISEEDEEGRVSTPDWPNPVRRQGVWKARQVAHWTGEEASTPELNYSVWANGTWG